MVNCLIDGRFRRNPSYELLSVDRLPAAHPVYAALAADTGIAGVLQPSPGSGLSAKAVDHETAVLLRALGAGCRLSQVLNTTPDARTSDAIAGLVLDGVLEIEIDGRFRSGTAAHGAFFPERAIDVTGGRIATLSHQALLYAQTLPIDDPVALATRLYTYNTIPAGPRRRSFLDGDQAVGEALGWAQRNGAYRKIEHPAWHVWSRHADGAEIRSVALPYKLYVSPHPDCLAEVLARTVEVFVRFEVESFKLGRGAAGLVRPDKFVAYLNDREQLDRVAGALRGDLARYRPHGVPFTSPCTTDGMLSWGADPPTDEGVPGWQRRESWRTWITNHLAVSMIQARRHPAPGVEGWRFAIDRLSLEGVDPARWSPPTERWLDPLAAPEGQLWI
ncbi:MAG TPA: hypothetical protein VKB09_14090 [Thermomicrobiales bacterium]|nr:hypothetical protein [Thermomicrobiales bacterium]